jgi:hypothetical protein
VAKNINFELAIRSRDEFAGYFAALLGELLDGVAESKRLGRVDQMGTDAFVLDVDNDTIRTVIQCKGFEVGEYGKKQHEQCRAEIAKFKAVGPMASKYWLIVNRPIKDNAQRRELEDGLTDLVRSGKVGEAELLDQAPLFKRLNELASVKLTTWLDAQRRELFEFYRTRLEVVRPIEGVPFNEAERDPAAFLKTRCTRFFQRLAKDQTGKYRKAPKFLVTSEFGFGKTTTLHALARAWVKEGSHLIYAPAALLGHQAFMNASGLADSLLQLVLPEEAKLGEMALQIFRDVLRELMTRSKDWLVLIDGLDENSYAFNANSLPNLWGSIADLGIPVVISARNELVEVRQSEFQRNEQLKVGPQFERINLKDWNDALILEFIDRLALERGGDISPVYQSLRELVASGRYHEVYGDIPRRPLFLGMLAEDAWAGVEPARHLHRLYGTYFKRKFDIDRISIAARGMQNRPSEIVDRFGHDQAKEMLVRVMQDAAGEMLELSDVGGGNRQAIHHDTIGEKSLQRIAAGLNVPFAAIEDVVMHSLLQPAGRHAVSRERLFRFAHRSFQDWFLARHFADNRLEPYLALPPFAFKFLSSMLEDLSRGEGLA